MMNNKLEKLAIFITYIVIILFGLSIAAFIFKELFSYKYITELSKDHGSLIAGLIGVGGVAWLVINQNRETNKLIKSEYEKIKYEVFEKNKEKALDHLHFVNQKLVVKRQIGVVFKSGENIITSDNFQRDFFNPIFNELYYLSSYIEKIDGSLYSKKAIESSKFLFHLIHESLYYDDHADDGVFGVYGTCLVESLKDLKDIGALRNVPPYDGFGFTVNVEDKKYSLQDIIDGISCSSDPRSLNELNKYIGMCYIWIKGVFQYGFDEEIKQVSIQNN